MKTSSVHRPTARLIVAALAISACCVFIVGAGAPQGHGGGGSTPPPNPEIAFGNSGIKVMNADGTNVRTVVSLKKGESAYRPGWSPDGQQLLFWGKLGNVQGIWTVNLDGTNRTRVAPNNLLGAPSDWARQPAPDGVRKICFLDYVPGLPGQFQRDVFLVNPDGTGLVNLTNTLTAHESAVCWTNDGSRLICSRGTELVALNLGLDVDGAIQVVSEETLYTMQAGFNLTPIHYANTFEGITLYQFSNGKTRACILDLSVLPPTLRVLTNASRGEDRYSSFSPGDSKLVISRIENTGWNVYTISFDGTGEKKIGKGSEASWKRPPPP